MADVTITIPNEHIPRIKEAWEQRFARLEGETDVDFFRRGVAELVKRVVYAHEYQKAKEASEAGIDVSTIAS